jgi:glycosyltransferase involved in cell wall biosynthesis
MPPLITVITPAYNRAWLLPQAMDSVLRQSFQGFRYIIVDDASTDRTAAIVETTAQADPRITLVRHRENRGPGPARNTALALCESDYVAFLDSDDLWEPEFLATMYRHLAAEGENCQAAFCWSRTIDFDGLCMDGEAQQPPPVGRYDLVRTFKAGNPPRNGSSLLVRKAAIQRAGGFGERRLGEDAELWLEMLSASREAYFSCVGSYLVHRRRHAGTSAHTVSARERVASFEYRLTRYLPCIPADERRAVKRAYKSWIRRERRRETSEQRWAPVVEPVQDD